jgi:inosine-uridine nucleoside N-ribohydrolase
MKIWIDTDTGIDDALAIMLALRSPEIQVAGISSVHGNVDSVNAARNAKRVAESLGTDIPVWQGAKASLLGEVYPCPEAHGRDGLGDTPGLPLRKEIEPGFGPIRLAERLLSDSDPLTVVALGPLTNIALALSYEPHCFSDKHRLVIMGGAMFCEGNQTPSAEFNTIPQTWISLDVTMKTIMPNEWCKELLGHADNEVAKFVGQMTLFYSRWYQEMYGLEGFAMHDPLAIGYLLWPSLYRLKPVYLDVELSGSLSRGRTVADLLPESFSRTAPNAHIAIDVDSEAFLLQFKQHVP